MVTLQKDVYYRQGIWHLDLTQKMMESDTEELILVEIYLSNIDLLDYVGHSNYRLNSKKYIHKF